MAANNKTLLTKFTQLFNSSSYLDMTKSVLLATRMMGFLEPNGVPNLPKQPAQLLNAVSQRLDALLTNDQVTDANFVAYLMTFDAQNIKAMGHDLLADVMESAVYQALPVAQRRKFESQANDVFGFLDVDYSKNENLNGIVLNEGNLRRMVDASAGSKRAKTTAHGKIDNALTTFDNLYRAADIAAVCNGPKHYGNVFTSRANLVAKLRDGYVNLLGDNLGNKISDVNESMLNPQAQQAQTGVQNADLIGQIEAYDQTVLALMKRRKIDDKKYPRAFLGTEIDGSDKNNQHFLANLATNLLGAGKTFGIAAGASFAVNLLSQIPVVGNYLGGTMAIMTAVKKAHSEYKQASQIAAAQNRSLGPRDAARIAINTAASVAPYAATMVLGPVGRYIGAGSMMVKTFFTDISKQRAKLRYDEKLSVKDYLSTAGKAILHSTALWLGGKFGSTFGSAVTENFDGHGFADDLRAKLGIKPKLQTLQTENFNHENIVKNTDGVSLDAPEKDYAMALQETQNNQDKVFNVKLTELQNHRFDLTDAARSTANPDTDRMFQMNQASGQYQQQDWYNTAEYQRAVDTLHNAGVQDADGALRNLAGARMFKGGAFKTELDNLLNGKLTTNTIDKILEADSILDEHADLIGGHSVPQPAITTHLAPERVTDYNIEPEPVVAEPIYEPAVEPELITNPEISADPTFGPDRMADYNLQETVSEQPLTAPEHVVPEPVMEQEPVDMIAPDPTFGPERMTSYEIKTRDVEPELVTEPVIQPESVTELEPVMNTDPTFGPERMGNYSIQESVVESDPVTEPEPTVEPASIVEAKSVVESQSPVGLDRLSTFTLKASAFANNDLNLEQVNTDVVTDWRD